MVNQLHNLLSRTFPELAVVCCDISSVGILNLLTKYPTPDRIAAARPVSLEKVPYVSRKVAAAVREAAGRSVASLRGNLVETLVKELVQQVRAARAVKKRLEKLVEQAFDDLPDSQVRLLLTIPGIGKRTAAILAAKIVSIDRFSTPDKLVGYFGVFPEESSSGVDKHGRPLQAGSSRMSTQGNDLARGYLWMAAQSAMIHNPAVRPLYRRLRAKGKRGDVALGHCMRKLLHLVFAIWKTNRPFDPNHYPWDGGSTTSTVEVPQSTGQRDVLPSQAQAPVSQEDRKVTIGDASHNLEIPEQPQDSITESIKSEPSRVEMSLEDLPSAEPVVGRSP